jgi:hypothetical protein
MKKTLLMGIMFGAIAVAIATSGAIPPAYANHKPGHENADDRNNPTFPGGGAGNTPPDQANNERASENTVQNCDKHDNSGKGSPAQCYFGDGK